VVPSAEQRAVIDHQRGRLRVLAGPGTGKTATIVEAVADRVLRRGIDPGSMLVLTFSRRAAAELSERIAARLDVTVTEPLVRTLHSYAYALVRSSAVAAGDPPPRLLDAGQADLMVREMLAGHSDAGGGRWPEPLRAALRVPAFAAELREFLLRAAEREIGPRRIAELARRHRRPEWRAVAEFITEYRDVADLRQASSRLGAALDQAELTVAALDRLAEPAVLGAQQARIRRIFVDEYQDVDPAQARLIDLLAGGADELVVVGDPDQAIYAFRGAAAGALERLEVDGTVTLTTSHRMPAELLAATRRVAAQLPGAAAHRQLCPADAAQPGGPAGPAVPAELGVTRSVEVRTLPSAAREAAFVADQLRRAHAQEGIAWSDMAVLVRSPARSADLLRRACAAAGVPVATAVAALPLAADPLVSALLAVLRAGLEPWTLTAEVALSLLSGPLGGMDPLALRRLRRSVRSADRSSGSSGDVLAAVLGGQRDLPDGVAADLAAPMRTLMALIDLARSGAAEPAGEDVLWRIWQRSGLARGLVADSERGGREAVAADAMLDAVVALFDRAAELADQLPGAGVRGLLELVGGQQIPGTPRPVPGGAPAADSVLSAHAAKGLQWELVVGAGVQQDSWPDLRRRTSLLGLPELLDAHDGMRHSLPLAGLLADERRLFYVAVTRARRRLVVTAVDDQENSPSRFLTELAGTDELPAGWPRDPSGAPRRALHLPALIAELRRAVTAPDPDPPGGVPDVPAADAAVAATALARLAVAGVPGANPDSWHGLAPLSSRDPLVADGAPVTLSPSQVESLLACPLRSVLERSGARTPPGQPQLLGIAVHALAQGIAAGVSDAELSAATDQFLAGQDQLPAWEVARLRRMVEAMTRALRSWVATSCAGRTFAGSELPVEVVLPEGDGQDRPVRLVGRVDWLSRDAQGRPVVTDFKTGASVPTRSAVREHAQLAVYQLAAALGVFDQGGPATDDRDGDAGAASDGHADATHPAIDHDRTPLGLLDTGGAELVYLRTGTPKTLVQPPLAASDGARWTGQLRQAAESAAGAVVLARQGETCDRCPVRSCCPLQPEGRQVVR
jgi:superfamily I DNA/RNA helicase/RecB family exonuclease